MSETLDTVADKVRALSLSVDERFAQMDERFAQMDARFAQVDARFAQVDARFAQVDERFDWLEKRIVEEGEKTRRHFDMVAEHMKAERNLVLDSAKATEQELLQITAANAADHVAFERLLADHEERLKRLEQA